MKSMLRSKERVLKKGFNMRNRMSGEGEKKGRSKGGKEGRCLPLYENGLFKINLLKFS